VQVNNQSIGILSIATNSYIEYWFDLIQSYVSSPIFTENQVTFHLFTDQPEKVSARLAKYSKKISVNLYEIPSYGWPEATLFRYKIYKNFLGQIHNDVLIHIDADMLIVGESLSDVSTLLGRESTFLVSHPGFWRPKGFGAFKFYFRNPNYLAKDLILKSHLGGLGAWETSQKSYAYVCRDLRKNYVAGGFWGGKRDFFLKLCSELDNAVSLDLENNIVAKWHDESHLNKWATENHFNLCPPTYCYAEGYPNLIGIQGVIKAVEKNLAHRDLT
jgi:hypothetical protein